MPNHSFATPEDHCASEPSVKRITLHGNAVHAGSIVQVMEIRVGRWPDSDCCNK
jgi:hypothetical protein